MKDSIERLVRDLGAISIDNLVSTEESPTNNSGLHPEDYYPATGRYLYLTDEQYIVNKI